jgi:hypothetical protein
MPRNYVEYRPDSWRFKQFWRQGKTKGPASFNRVALSRAAARDVTRQNAMLTGTDLPSTLKGARAAFRSSDYATATTRMGKLTAVGRRAGAVGRVGFSTLGGIFSGLAAYEGYQHGGGIVGAYGGVAGFHTSVTMWSSGFAAFSARTGGIGAMGRAFGAGMTTRGNIAALAIMGLVKVHNIGKKARSQMEFGEQLIDNPMLARMRGQAYQGMMGTKNRMQASMQYTAHRRDRIVDSLGDEAQYLHL